MLEMYCCDARRSDHRLARHLNNLLRLTNNQPPKTMTDPKYLQNIIRSENYWDTFIHITSDNGRIGNLVWNNNRPGFRMLSGGHHLFKNNFWGMYFSHSLSIVKSYAQSLNCSFEFTFNDTLLTITPLTDEEEIWAERNKIVAAEYEEYRNSYRYRRQQELDLNAKLIKKEKYDNMISISPNHMALSNPEKWVELKIVNSDSYGSAILEYAECWARFMEGAISTGKCLNAVAEELSYLANTDGNTGFTYGAAVSILSEVWIYGDDLRRWHNLDSQIGNEGEIANENGGTLNPALLSIG